MNIKDIQQLIKFVAKSGVSEVKIESKDLKIGIKTGSNQNPVVYSPPQTIISPPQSVPNIESNSDIGNEKEIVSEAVSYTHLTLPTKRIV